MEMAVFIFGVIVLGILAVLIVLWRLGSGARTAVAHDLASSEILDEVQSYFVKGGWRVEATANDYILLQRPADGCTGLLFLVIFLPLGILYLLTGWGHGKLEVTTEDLDGGGVLVNVGWSDAIIRRDIDKLIEWLESEDEPS